MWIYVPFWPKWHKYEFIFFYISTNAQRTKRLFNSHNFFFVLSFCFSDCVLLQSQSVVSFFLPHFSLSLLKCCFHTHCDVNGIGTLKEEKKVTLIQRWKERTGLGARRWMSMERQSRHEPQSHHMLLAHAACKTRISHDKKRHSECVQENTSLNHWCEQYDYTITQVNQSAGSKRVERDLFSSASSSAAGFLNLSCIRVFFALACFPLTFGWYFSFALLNTSHVKHMLSTFLSDPCVKIYWYQVVGN